MLLFIKVQNVLDVDYLFQTIIISFLIFIIVIKKTKGDWKSIRKCGWQKIKDEIEKCDLLCANCHRHVEYGALSRI